MPKNSILIVDDDPSGLAILKQILGNDYSLKFARNGTECLDAVSKHHPDLILMDVDMPGANGYAICQILKNDPLTENIPVIFITAMNEIGDETAGFSSGGVDYIVKPVSPRNVKARVAIHMSLIRAKLIERRMKQLEIVNEKSFIKKTVLRRSKSSGETQAITATVYPPELMTEAPENYACRFEIETMFAGQRMAYGVDEFQAVILALQLIETILSKQDQDYVILEIEGGAYRCHTGQSFPDLSE